MEKITFHTERQITRTIKDDLTLERFKANLILHKPKGIFNSEYSSKVPCWYITEYINDNEVMYYADNSDKIPQKSTIDRLYNSWVIQGLNSSFFIVEDKSSAIIPVDVDLEIIPDWQRTTSWAHLQAWFMGNETSPTYNHKPSRDGQIMFIRDEFINLFGDEVVDISVISTHTSKSVKLPVYYIRLKNGVSFIMRGNFHDWKISINSPFALFYPEEILSNDTLKGEKILHCYCEGFKEEWIYDSYMENKYKFTLEIPGSTQVLFTFLFLSMIQTNKHVIKELETA